MTIREALWAARLSSFVKIRQKPLAKLFDFILEYSHQELMNELYGYDFNPTVDIELYQTLTDKPFNDPVIDDKGSEIKKSQTSISVRQAVEAYQGKNAKIKSRPNTID